MAFDLICPPARMLNAGEMATDKDTRILAVSANQGPSEGRGNTKDAVEGEAKNGAKNGAKDGAKDGGTKEGEKGEKDRKVRKDFTRCVMLAHSILRCWALGYTWQHLAVPLPPPPPPPPSPPPPSVAPPVASSVPLLHAHATLPSPSSFALPISRLGVAVSASLLASLLTTSSSSFLSSQIPPTARVLRKLPS